MGATEMVEKTRAKKTSLDDDMSDEEFDKLFFSEDEKPKQPVHEDNADPVVPPNLVRNRPGAVRTQGEMVLHTKTAHRMFYGRRKDTKQGISAIIGLVRFALIVNKIHEAAAKDDPYADAVLIKIESKLNAAEAKIKESLEALDNLLGDTDGITINKHESVRPVTVPLEFKTTYGFIAARIVNGFDKVVREALSARHAGLITPENWGYLAGTTGKMIRDAFWEATRWQNSGITRDDIAANNARARDVIEKFGKLPQSILEGSKRGQFAPLIHKNSALKNKK